MNAIASAGVRSSAPPRRQSAMIGRSGRPDTATGERSAAATTMSMTSSVSVGRLPLLAYQRAAAVVPVWGNISSGVVWTVM